MSKYYTDGLFDTRNAMNKEEELMIKVHNMAVVSSIMTANKKGMNLRQEDIEDAGYNAGLIALEKLDPSKGGTSYGYMCGVSQAIKASERIEREKKLFRSMDELSGWRRDGEEDEVRELSFASDDYADSTFREEDEAEEREIRNRCIREAFEMLPERDQVMYLKISDGKSFSDIARDFDCTENSLYQRYKRCKEMFSKNFRKVYSSYAA